MTNKLKLINFHTFASMNFKANQIADILNGKVEGDDQISIDSLSKIEEGKKGSISFLGNPKYNRFLYTTKSSIIIVKDDYVLDKPIDNTLIRVNDPNESFSKLLNLFGDDSSDRTGVNDFCSIDSSVSIGNKVFIGSFSVCEKNSKLGDNVKIYPQVFVGENVLIGENTIIHSGVKIYKNSVIGKNCIIHSGTVIGSDGFGFNIDKDGKQKKVIHNGNVLIEDNVEIGSNTSIDKATLGSTKICSGVKIDNLVQIAHNVIIGPNTVIAAQVGIAGSTSIGSNCMIGGQVGISGHLKIGDRVMIQAKSGVLRNFESDTSIMGYPAIKYRDYNKSYVHFKNLPKIVKNLDNFIKNSNG